MESLMFVTTDQIVQIAIYVAILGVVWIIFKAMFRIAMRVFAFGCGAILVLGLLLVALRFIQ